ncbi:MULTISPECIES: hypothetical protein [unclassified Curtobacterium]|uniref:hypothetical protein n=1 Tax=unclassified Curtobacterium TaxID=257496 RepID=UPI000DA8C77E|nr:MULTISPECIES: hypothetical protein [unclassified Curtobacterium]PZE76660.1 hypothetical protein DEI82_05760 [Curtobacterium sp. MCBD17_019]WIE55735.1 hypothetical protein DEI88_005910 [Curtobacterium sp. MCBD17_003]
MTTIRSILYTAHPAAWHDLATALGLRRHDAPADGDWTEFDGDGVLAIRGVDDGSADDGRVDLQVLVADLPAVRRELDRAELAVRTSTLADVGELLTVDAAGAPVAITTADRAAVGGDLSVMPIRYASSVAEAARVFRAIGLGPRIAADGGGWADFTADGGGLAALHEGADGRTELSFEHRGDLDTLAARLRAGGYEADVVDEAYNRTVLVTTPDGWRLWVNGAQEDLHGYSRQD